MKKTLPVLWIIIIVAVVFIAIELAKPDASQEDIKVSGTTEEEDNETESIDLSQISEEEAPKTFSEHLALGDKYFNEANYYTAITNYEYAAKLNPNSEETLFKLAEAYLKNKNFKDARAVYNKITEVNSDSIDAYIGIAETYLQVRDIEKAKEVIWEIEQETVLKKYYTGLILILYKDFDGAKNNFEEIVSEDSLASEELKTRAEDFLDAYEIFETFDEGDILQLETLLAKTMVNNEQYEPAIPLLFDVIQQKNNYRDSWLILGYAYLNTDKTLDAIDALEKAKDLDPEKPETLFFLGLAYFSNNEIDNAIFYLEAARRFDFEPKEQIDLKLGDLYLLKKEYKKAAQKFENVITKNPTNINIYVKAIHVNIDELKDYDRALELAEEAYANHPNNAMSHNLLGWALTAKDNLKQASIHLAEAIGMDPYLDAAYLNFAWLYQKDGQITLAKEYYKRAHSLGNGNEISDKAATEYNKLEINPT